MQSECFQPVNLDGRIFALPPNSRLHISGGWVHDSHQMRLNNSYSYGFVLGAVFTVVKGIETWG